MRAIQIPDELAERVEAKGITLERFVIDALEEKLATTGGVQGRTLNELLAEGWTLPTVSGLPRPDGRPWSEIEAACEPD